MKQTKLFCEKDKTRYINFFSKIIQVKMCGANEEDIIRVNVREVNNNENPTHYGWWDNKDNMFYFIYETKAIVSMCFPYGYEICE